MLTQRFTWRSKMDVATLPSPPPRPTTTLVTFDPSFYSRLLRLPIFFENKKFFRVELFPRVVIDWKWWGWEEGEDERENENGRGEESRFRIWRRVAADPTFVTGPFSGPLGANPPPLSSLVSTFPSQNSVPFSTYGSITPFHFLLFFFFVRRSKTSRLFFFHPLKRRAMRHTDSQIFLFLAPNFFPQFICVPIRYYNFFTFPAGLSRFSFV